MFAKYEIYYQIHCNRISNAVLQNILYAIDKTLSYKVNDYIITKLFEQAHVSIDKAIPVIIGKCFLVLFLLLI